MSETNGTQVEEQVAEQAEDKAEAQPVIAYDRLSVWEALDIGEMDNVMQEGAFLAALFDQKKATNEDIARLRQLMSADFQKGIIEKQCALLAKYVVSVPDDWFVPGSLIKTKFDCRKPETYHHLRRDKFVKLMTMLKFGGLSNRDISGN